MQSQIRIGSEWVPAPKFAIGDCVVHVVDCANTPESEWYDRVDPRPRFFWWYRGVIVSVELDYRGKWRWTRSPWLYQVRIATGYDSTELMETWRKDPVEMSEDELKLSPYTSRYFQRLAMTQPALLPAVA